MYIFPNMSSTLQIIVIMPIHFKKALIAFFLPITLWQLTHLYLKKKNNENKL